MTQHPSESDHSWRALTANRRVLAKAGALLGALALFDHTIGDAETNGSLAGSTQARNWFQDSGEDQVIAADGEGWSTLVTEFPCTAIGGSWSGAVGIWPLVDIRTSSDGSTYSDVVTLEADADLGRPELGDRTFTRLIFVAGATHIQFRTTDRNGKPVVVEGFGLTYIDASAGPTFDSPAVDPAAITTPPIIISRAGWGADESLRFSGGVEVFPRQYATVRHAIVHHSETSNDIDPLQQIRSIYYFHAITRGWGDIGYNYLVDRFGNIYEGRVGGQNVIGSHSLAHNVGAAGVCLIGNHIIANPTPEAVGGLVGILAWVCRNLDPLGFSNSWDLLNLPTICGHRDVNDTSCPGDLAYSELAAIRTAVATTIAESPPLPPGGFVVGDLVAVDTGDGVPVNLRSSPGLTSQVVAQLTDGMLASITGNPTQADGLSWYPIATSVGNGWIDPTYLVLQPPPLIASARFATWDVLAANRPTVVLLTAPDPAADVRITVPQGTLLRAHTGPRFKEGRIYYHLFYTDGSAGGWGEQEDFVLSTAPPSPQLPAIGDRVTVTDLVNFRSGAGLSFPVLRQLPIGTDATVIGGPTAANAYNWFQLQTAYGTGWAVADYLRVDGSSSPTPTPLPSKFRAGDTVVNPGRLNLRQQPSTSGSILATMDAGTIGTVLSGPVSANGYAWYQIQTRYGAGWAAGELLDAAAPLPTPTPTPPPSSGFPIGSTVRATTPVNLRSAASTSASVITVLPTNTTGTVTSGPATANGYTWFQVRTALGTGWVAGQFLVATSAPAGIQIGSIVRTTTAGLRLRSTASTSGAVVATMPLGTRGTVVAGSVSANGYTWWRIQTSLGTGWAAGLYLQVAT